jgi:hypothetical protein
MFSDADDAGHCSNALTARKFREASPEDRVTYRKWLRGIVFLYSTLLLLSGVAIAAYSGSGRGESPSLLASSQRMN